MAFSDINEEQKVRLTLSERAQAVVNDDMAGFGVSTIASFVNTVLDNYRSQAKSSIANCLERKQIELDQLFDSNKLDPQTKKKVIETLLRDEEERLKAETEKFRKQKGTSRLFHINDSNLSFLMEDCGEDKYYDTLSQYINSVIEEYCSLPYIDRERVFHKQTYDIVENACKNHKVLKISSPYYDTKKTFNVHPYKIIPDPLHTQSFLVGWSKKIDETEDCRIIAPFSMVRLKDVRELTPTYKPNKSRITAIEQKIATESPSYFLGEKEEIHVRLTEKGRIYYNNRLVSRPVCDPNKSTLSEYVFLCQEHQAFNYFCSFGGEAEIISPQSLRDRFASFFSCANQVYNK